MYICNVVKEKGALAHLARALDWQSKGDEFESRMLHIFDSKAMQEFLYSLFFSSFTFK